MRQLHKLLLLLAALFKLPVSPLNELCVKACVCTNTQTCLFRLGFSFEIHSKCALSTTKCDKGQGFELYAFMYCMRGRKMLL